MTARAAAHSPPISVADGPLGGFRALKEIGTLRPGSGRTKRTDALGPEENISVAEPSRGNDRKAEPKPTDSRGEETVVAIDPVEAAYRALHAERDALERALTLAQQRQQFGDDADAEAGRLGEAELLKDLDRVMTLIRAAEIRRSQPKARRWQ